jgi:MFS transporter, Spinster family, sphingosine-1-phosphate transporter
MEIPPPGPAIAPAARPPVPRATRAAAFALAVLFGMNLLNYVDRYVFAGVGKAIIDDLRLTGLQFGILGSAFMVVYTIVSPAVGWLGDRYSRRRLLAFGVGLWSVATVGTAFATNYGQMFLARALLGVGEASYGVVAPTLLADLFDPAVRVRVMGLFYLALPLGTAVGYGVGGWVETHYGWRAAFWVVGLPGLLLAFAGLLIRDPGRGASERRPAAGDDGHVGGPPAAARRPGLRDYLSLLRNRSFLLNTAGMAGVTFTIGAYGHWIPTFYQLVRKMPAKDNVKIGGLLALAGLVGVVVGMWVPDRLLRLTRRAYMLWPALAVLGAIPFGVAGLLDPDPRTSLILMFAASVLLTSCLGPCNTITANVVPANQRAVGYATSIFLLHLLGDIPSPPLIGKLAGLLARPAVVDSPLGRLLARLGAAPAASPTGPLNLTGGMLLIVPVLMLGSFCFFLGSNFLVRDQERARALGGPAPADSIAMH